MVRQRLLAAATSATVLVLVAGCSVHKTDAPSLTGPSGLGTNVTISISPDVLPRDGQSQALVTVTATNANGQPLPNLSLRLAVVDPQSDLSTDALGTLSAINVVTNGSGQATATYIAPCPVGGNGTPRCPGSGIATTTTTIAEIGATPAGTDFGNETQRVAQIELVPQGVIGAPLSSLRPDFTVPSATVGDAITFTATVVDSKGNNAAGQVVSYSWDFGDGGKAAGPSATHTFSGPGNFPVMLTIIDTESDQAFVTHTVTVGQGQLPIAAFTVSPSSPNLNQPINFNASGSTAEPGHTITSYAWDFGDGTTGSGVTVTHAYTQAGSYTVTLQVTDDANRKSQPVSQGISVGLSAPTAKFTTSPATPVANQPINFNATQSTVAPNRTIVSYSWDFGDGTSGSGVTTTHAYATPATYTVTLTVTDSAGQQGFANQTITVQSDVPTAAFTITPFAPTAPTGTNASVGFNASGSSAVNGKTITAYSWTITFASGAASLTSASGVTTSGNFIAPGTYTVTLVVTDSGGKTNSVSQTFTVTGT